MNFIIIYLKKLMTSAIVYFQLITNYRKYLTKSDVQGGSGPNREGEGCGGRNEGGYRGRRKGGI